MADASSLSVESSTPKAVKDKNCPFCQQAFTSSSLGRHLDLYIKERNPKGPDGVHDVDAIRKLRGNITRRQAKAALSRRGTSASVGTPTAGSRRSPASEYAESPMVKSPVSLKEGAPAGDSIGRQYPFNTPWEATGVINDVPAPREGDGSRAGEGDSSAEALKPPLPPPRAASRQSMKQQLDTRQRVQDALDTARAAELALREIVGSWRAAKQQFDMNSMPFDFDPLSLDFPTLTLQCLEPPPTLFSSTQHPTSTSWSILPPGPKQYDALQAYFEQEFKKWKITCATAVTAVNEDLPYPPPLSAFKPDTKEEVRKAEKKAEVMEKQVFGHIQSTYDVWNALPSGQRQNLWILELARGVGRKQKEIEKLHEVQFSLRQDNMNLKSQIEHLNRLQQPREFKIAHPSTIFIDPKMMDFIHEESLRQWRGVGLNISDRHSDLNTIVSSAIDRWKNVIVSTRSASGGLQSQRPLNPPTVGSGAFQSQRPLNRPAGESASGELKSAMTSSSSVQAQLQTAQSQSQQSQPPLVSAAPNPPQSHHSSVVNSNALAYAASAASLVSSHTSSEPHLPSTNTTDVPHATPSINIDANEDEDVEVGEDEDDGEDDDEEMSDQDADADADADGDAEMDDDSQYASMITSTIGDSGSNAQAHQMQQQQQQQQHHTRHIATLPAQSNHLGVSRTRGEIQQQPQFLNRGNSGLVSNRSVTHGGGQAAHGTMNTMHRSITGMGTMQARGGGPQQHHNQHHNNNNMVAHGRIAHTDMSMMQGVAGGEPMYMD
ncbi:hypothetical protein B0H63DRAFT_200293 [Podospora didyma]|uniref:Uncharacterized protein n=1 Tax=Podospora didyma TaxID=330526 RepID=A0AAE0TVQ8_9PEZI|nr:hypothetical protein B0H63DRAFT_200293 [Podospora didyma]